MSCPAILPSPTKTAALCWELPAPLTAPLNSHCLSQTLLGDRDNKLPFIGASLTKQKFPSVQKKNPPLSPLVDKHVGTFQVRRDLGRGRTYAGEADDGIRVFTTYRPAFLPSTPAVRGGTMGSLVQTREMNEPIRL